MHVSIALVMLLFTIAALFWVYWYEHATQRKEEEKRIQRLQSMVDNMKRIASQSRSRPRREGDPDVWRPFDVVSPAHNQFSGEPHDCEPSSAPRD